MTSPQDEPLLKKYIFSEENEGLMELSAMR